MAGRSGSAPSPVTVSPKLLSLSVVLATFNERDNLGPMLEQLRALLGQRHRLELIVVDDDFPRWHLGLVRRLARQDPRIHLIRRVGLADSPAPSARGCWQPAAKLRW